MYSGFCTKYKIKAHSVQKIVANENIKIRVDTRVQITIKVNANQGQFCSS
ncbi:hypothetical protein PAEPH01_1105 [Pancytospora epiphaga]|nr:hypothetical protein PAEPH01_1105 [Pancytospora epiphaga]